MTEEKEEKNENPTLEKIESVGQIIMGELEKIGGILTADPISQAEGELTKEAGKIHLEIAEELEEKAQNSQ
jgi:hypothetical protein